MPKVELTGRVGADHMFLMDKPKELKGVWLPQVEGKTEAKPMGEMLFIKDPNTLTKLLEAETEEEAIQKAKNWLKEVHKIKPLQS